MLGGVRDVLSPRGYLLLGASETTLNIDDGFERLPVGHNGWYRRKATFPA